MKINLKGIRFRLITWYILSLGVVHLVVAVGLYRTMSARLHQELDRRLETYSTCLVELLPQHRQLPLAKVVGEMAHLTGLGSNLYVRVVDGTQQVVYESTDSPVAVAEMLRAGADIPASRPMNIQARGSGLWRMLSREIREEGKLLYAGVVAVPLREVEQALAQLRFVLIVVVPGVLALVSFGGWLLLNRVLRPLREVTQGAQRIQAKQLDHRLCVPQTGDEVQALAETFNEMIGRLERSVTQLRQFTADVSHELRTPLTTLKGEVELGLSVRPRDENSQQILERCAAEIDRLSRLVEGLLFLSSADAEKVELDLRPVRVGPLLQEMAEGARILAAPRRIQVELTHGFDGQVNADEMRLKQLLLNLIDNAVKYTPEGGRVSLGSKRADGQLELSVADTGLGIEPAELSRIFDRFYRGDCSHHNRNGGFGLGLAICKWIAEAHRGSIHVESVPGQGSVFRVRLPLA
ncbi:MAG: HAMP domain-containing protein [Verrucomicrobia bacterium]|nr:HAMP domain-containing protein [Verrucomicrobiota bacterium]